MKEYPERFDEFAEENKIVDYKEVYTLGDELIPITRVKWWLEWWQDKKSKKGHWIYDNEVNNWRCSHCHGIPKIMGYVGTEEFMKENFNYCPICGAEMEGEQDVV